MSNIIWKDVECLIANHGRIIKRIAWDVSIGSSGSDKLKKYMENELAIESGKVVKVLSAVFKK